MEENPLVSICMPAYNAGKYIAEAINSIITQSYQNWELIIVNDGSTDNTAEEIAAFADPRISSHHQENKGQCAAANKAFSVSKGNLIKFFDADDILSPDFIKNQVAQIKDNDNAIAYASWGRFYNDDLATFNVVKNLTEGDMPPIDWLITNLNKKTAMMQCGLWLIPRNILLKAGLWDESLTLINDLEFFIRVVLHAKVISFTKNAILYYRSGSPASLSALKSRKGVESAYHSIDKGTSYILNFENSERTRKTVANCFQNYIYTFYPSNKDLIAHAQKKVNALGGADVIFQAGGYTLILQKLVGWKLTARIKSLFAR